MEEKNLFSEKASAINAALVCLVLSVIPFVLAYLCLMAYFGLDAWSFGFPLLAIGGLMVLIALLMLVFGRDSQICITDKRVYGKTLLGKRVDLPLDSISSVGLTNPLLQGLSVSSNSGNISFYLISNRNKAHEILSKLIIERQEKPKKTVVMQETVQSSADEIKKFKELLDMGVITEEEFNAKKKELLGL